MGINTEGLKYCQTIFDKICYNVRMFEFGDQVGFKNKIFAGAAKYHWESLGVQYTSLDLSGQNGSLKRDITDDNTDLGKFDLVTNFGSSEHVEPFHKQYDTFKTLHNLCNVGGYMVHQVPPVGYWINHSPAHYTNHFFIKLAELNGYHTVLFEPLDGAQLIACIMIKQNDTDFISRDIFPVEEIIWEENSPNKGNYR
jgi:hypothetical protein